MEWEITEFELIEEVSEDQGGTFASVTYLIYMKRDGQSFVMIVLLPGLHLVDFAASFETQLRLYRIPGSVLRSSALGRRRARVLPVHSDSD